MRPRACLRFVLLTEKEIGEYKHESIHIDTIRLFLSEDMATPHFHNAKDKYENPYYMVESQ